MNKTFKAMKFNIGNNPSLCKAIQKRLFKLGYEWVDGTTVQFPNALYLYGHSDGRISYTDSPTSSWFEDQPHTEIDIEWMKPKERKTIEVGDKTYYEDELAEALSKINEVE